MSSKIIPLTLLTAILGLPIGALAQGPAGPAPAPLPDANAPVISGARAPHNNLDATLWSMTAVEARAVQAQTFQMAGLRLEGLLKDKRRSAALEQGPGFSRLPPAIILDVDETILENSPVQGRIIKSGKPWDSAIWEKWVNEARAEALPGAVSFLRDVHRRGIKIFYVSNRTSRERKGTELNLRRRGFPMYPDGSNLLLVGDRPGWTGDKTSRRAFLAGKYRVLMLFGDDFNDFVSAKTNLSTRDVLHKKHEERWGRTWFALPNPMYGSWERAITGYQRATAAQNLQSKYEALRSGPRP